jgi:hypothetical protein
MSQELIAIARLQTPIGHHAQKANLTRSGLSPQQIFHPSTILPFPLLLSPSSMHSTLCKPKRKKVSPLPWLSLLVVEITFTILSPLPWLFHIDKRLPVFFDFSE